MSLSKRFAALARVLTGHFRPHPDILNVSKLNMGLLSINVAPFDLTAAAREVVRTFGTSAQQQQIDLSVDRGESLDRLGVSYIVADEGRCKQVLYNFVRADEIPL